MEKEAKAIWQTLSAIDVSEHTEKKGKLTYLSWAWAWSTLMEHYPSAQYHFGADIEYGDTLMVQCDMRVLGVTHNMWLPVMDNRNNAVSNPTARQISDTRMRCLTKCISMFGLGHYIYAGEDLPVSSQKDLEEDIKNAKANFVEWASSIDDETMEKVVAEAREYMKSLSKEVKLNVQKEFNELKTKIEILKKEKVNVK
tara:strand:- start:204 stop:797 length:594 start_codon:yes stop_codon:yes gene_type:complete